MKKIGEYKYGDLYGGVVVLSENDKKQWEKPKPIYYEGYNLATNFWEDKEQETEYNNRLTKWKAKYKELH